MRLVLILVLICVTPAFSSDQGSRENYVLLKTYIDRVLMEKDRYIDSKIENLKESLVLSQVTAKEALELSRVELDRRFVRIEEYTPERSKFTSELQSLDKRLALVETEGRWQSTMWALGVSVFFSVIIVAMKLWDRKKTP